MKKFYVVCYDVTNNKLRRKIEKVLKGYGTRLQYSIFQCRLKEAVYQKMKNELRMLAEGMMWKETDSIIILVLCASCNGEIEVIGEKAVIKDDYYVI